MPNSTQQNPLNAMRTINDKSTNEHSNEENSDYFNILNELFDDGFDEKND